MKSKLKIVSLLIVIILFIAAYPSVLMQSQTVEWKAPASANTMKNPLPYNEESIQKGKSIFVSTCVPCHGDKGKGDGIASIGLKTKPGNLISAKVQSQTDGAIFWKITKGKAPMPNYDCILTEEQRWQLVNYIRKLAKTENKNAK
ncbi:MAG: cytochrome c [Bacteroidetes bacterium]|nr:MAG: cytochrome c [Bacteroidota bacterium]